MFKKSKYENYHTEFDFEFDLDSYQPTTGFHPYRHKPVLKIKQEEKTNKSQKAKI